MEINNPDKLTRPLSKTEFAQVEEEISNLDTPYHAGQFLYGLNGKSQVEVDLDDNHHVFLTVFDQDEIGAGNTVYQIVNQIQREPVLAGRKSRRFDTTLLVNGLPIIQIEEKADGVDAKTGLNQMHQYIAEQQYTGFYSTLQILVAIAHMMLGTWLIQRMINLIQTLHFVGNEKRTIGRCMIGKSFVTQCFQFRWHIHSDTKKNLKLSFISKSGPQLNSCGLFFDAV